MYYILTKQKTLRCFEHLTVKHPDIVHKMESKCECGRRNIFSLKTSRFTYYTQSVLSGR